MARRFAPVPASFVRFGVSFLAAVVLFGVGSGCDHVRPVEDELQPPLVADLRVVPDTALITGGGSESDSLAQVPLDLAASAMDDDGTVERVMFTIEPSLNPRATVAGSLTTRREDRYGRQLALSVPTGREELFTVRVFAVDDDSLASNQAVGQFRVLPAAE